MAKQTGLGWTTLNVDDSGGTARDIRNDCTNLDFSVPIELQDTTGLDKSAMERLPLLADFTITLNGVFNPATNQSHDVFKDVAGGVARTIVLGVGGASLTNECLITGYNLSRDTSGAFTWEAPGSLSDGTVPTWA